MTNCMNENIPNISAINPITEFLSMNIDNKIFAGDGTPPLPFSVHFQFDFSRYEILLLMVLWTNSKIQFSWFDW